MRAIEVLITRYRFLGDAQQRKQAPSTTAQPRQTAKDDARHPEPVVLAGLALHTAVIAVSALAGVGR